MKNELEYSVKKLQTALVQLRNGCSQARTDLEKDGVIQRFEFTFELLWKTIKLFLREKGVETKTPKDSLKEAFRIGWLTNEKIFMQMLKDRNDTSHVYSKPKSRGIFTRIKAKYVGNIEKILETLKRLLREQ